MAELAKITRCKDCKYHHWEQEPEHGKTIHLCSVLNAEVFKDFYCYHGTPKERGADKPKITCLNCKHLVFSDMYGECNKQLRIVNPSDTCEYAEPKERGGEK